MTISDQLRAAFDAIDKAVAEEKAKADDSSAEQATEQVSDEDVEDIFAEQPAVEVEAVEAQSILRDDETGALPADIADWLDEELETDDDTPDTWAQASDAAAPLVRNAIKIKGLDEKAVLVELKRSMFGTSKLDTEESQAYGAGNVVKHLFKGTANRMAKVKSHYTDVYTYVNDNTLPWAKGVRMLNIDHYMDFTKGVRERIDAADAAAQDLVANWDYEVQEDLYRLQRIAQEIAERFKIEVRFMPVPTAGDFRVNISDEDKASLQKQLEEAEDQAAKHVIEQMLRPMQAAAEKLATPIGKDGSIFRDSLIDNMVEVAERMERINVSDDPEVADKIAALKSLVGAYADNKEVLRSSQSVREKAATQISDLVKNMAGLV
jgi:hypothetical protein